MNIIEICESIISLYENPSEDKRTRSLVLRLVYELDTEIDNLAFEPGHLEVILKIASKMATTPKKALGQKIEGKLLDSIAYLPHELWWEGEGQKSSYFGKERKGKDGKFVDLFINFACKIYEFKRDRDAFTGIRKGYAVKILGSVSDYFDVPEYMKLCIKSIKSKSKNEFMASVESLKTYYLENNKLPSNEIIEIIDKRIEKTKHREEAVSGLDLQVETGLISDYDAQARMDKWREKNH